jgi:outer membrane receptor protein involved in Fe transport
VTYLIDGLQVDEAFSGESRSVDVETDVVEDLEVITGTFNAEYGRAMSGVVNTVIKEGGNRLSGSASMQYANFVTLHDDIFPGLNSGNPGLNLSQDYRIQLQGPVIRDRLSFLANLRTQNINGHLNGIRRFTARDYNDYSSESPAEWHSERTGDNKLVSMSHTQDYSFLGKLTAKPLRNAKVSLMYSLNDQTAQGYSHYLKYNPDARGANYHVSHFTLVSLNHMLSRRFFYEFKASYLHNNYQNYAYRDPLDTRYLHPRYHGLGYPGFSTGGSPSPGKSSDVFLEKTFKVDMTWQLNSHHSIKHGLQLLQHTVDRQRIDVRNIYYRSPLENISVQDPATGKIDWPYYQLEVLPVTDKTMDVYKVRPMEYALYLQDKMEFDQMVINLGLRYDAFDPDQVYPTDRRNPDNELLLPDHMRSRYVKAARQTQFSPRFGLAYKLSDQAVLHFSYGHFFQMPPMYALYANNIFRVPLADYGTTMGNSQLHAQKTITYEIGLWQELTRGMGLELALYYRDIYDLLSAKVVSTYNQIEYGLYTNKDYGNARGLEVKWNYTLAALYTEINYTLGYTKGNADNPLQTFTRAGNSMDPIKRLIPMSWDQRHTLNLIAGYTTRNFSATLTAKYNSGVPYTFSPLRESSLYNVNLYQNNDYQPSGYSVDLTGYYQWRLGGTARARILFTVYNLLDRLNAVWVYSDTGQPYTTVVREGNLASHHSDFNDYYDRIKNPSAFSAPRQVKLGLGIDF